MKVIIDGKQDEFIKIFPTGDHWQCNTIGHHSAHNFKDHPKYFPKNQKVKTNGHIYIFPSN